MLIAALLLAQAASACTATDAALPPALAGWTRHAASLDGRGAVTLPANDPAALAGVPKPARPGKALVATFRAPAPGTYGVALDQRAWIDVYAGAGGTPLVSVAHEHGPACSTIAKIVRFQLPAGVSRIVISGLETAAAKLMIVGGS